MALTLAGCGGGRDAASFELAPVEAGGPLALADLRVGDGRLTGRVVGWGFTPGSSHAVLLGPGSCPRGPDPRDAVSLGRLTANANGVAFARVDRGASADALADGRVLTLYAGPWPAVPVVCGDVAGSARIDPADVASAGPGGAARADVAALVQVGRDGRTIFGPPTVRARVGDVVALALRADLPDELALEGYGLAQQVGPGTIARFTFTATRAGSFALRGRVAGAPLLARLVVHER